MVPNVDFIVTKSLSLFKEFVTDIRISSKKVLHKPLLSLFVGVGFFDGSSKEGRCGSGMAMKLNEHIFNIWMGGDKGSNTRDELLGLWGILFFAKNCGIDSLIIFGDSKDVIEWVKGPFNLEVINLKIWCKRIKVLEKYFFNLFFMRISREYNSEADNLLKMATSYVFGKIFFQEVIEGMISVEDLIIID